MFRALATAFALANADFRVPEFTVDLEKDAYDRWAPVGKAILKLHGYEHTWGPLHDYLEKALPHKLWLDLEPLWERVLASFPKKYQDEVRAIFAFLGEQGHPWTLGQTVMVQLFYEVEDACTSIVAQHKNGTIFHGRNLDYGLPGLQNFTADVTFVRGDKFVSRGVMYVGYQGILTGQHLKQDGTATWSVSLNERFLSKKWVPYLPTVKAFLSGIQNVGFTLRDALEDKSDFKEARKYLEAVPLPSPSYLTLGGVKKEEGVVITRNRDGYSKIPFRGSWSLAAWRGKWYHLETNFDNWWPNFLTDGRRKAAHAGMDKLGREGADLDGIFDVLSTPPVLADHTTYTTVMLNEAGILRTTARDHEEATMQRIAAERLPATAAGLKELYDWYMSQPQEPIVV